MFGLAFETLIFLIQQQQSPQQLTKMDLQAIQPQFPAPTSPPMQPIWEATADQDPTKFVCFFIASIYCIRKIILKLLIIYSISFSKVITVSSVTISTAKCSTNCSSAANINAAINIFSNFKSNFMPNNRNSIEAE